MSNQAIIAMWGVIFLVVLIVIVLFLLNFYKDPKRNIPKGNNIVAPADGRVISIIDTIEGNVKIDKGLIGKIRTLTKDVAKQCYVISIFMSPFDAHINRAPISGKIISIRYKKGKFFKAYDMEKSFENEKNEILIQGRKLRVKVIQIAGFLARRIICNIRRNQKVNKGQKIGMIALGSQTTLIIQAGVELKVKINDKVKAGETIVAKLR